MVINIDIIKKAYKKLKSNLYYDKTMSITRDILVDYEMNGNIEDSLKDLFIKFSSEKSRHDMFKDILESISFFAYPKNFIDDKKDIIRNYILDGVNIKDVQYFIDMDIRGHILGVLWLMLIGYRVDKDIYEHSYGNRIRKKLYNEFSGEITYSPYLFEPYFQQYEGWRDNALDEALKHLHKGQDVVVLTMDFKRFYYSVDITKELMDELYDNVINIEDSTKELRDLNNFIYEVIVKYSKLIKEYDSRRILPIGFLPSNVLANYALRNFDKAILDGWNPVYFGRYVDDVIIVDKIEKNSALFAKSQDEDFDSDDVIGFLWNNVLGGKD